MKIKVFIDNPGYQLFYCPGCKEWHVIDHRWAFNGNIKNPTFNPSYKATDPDGKICHLFIRDGKIQYLNDCYHSLKGQTIDMVDVRNI